MNCSGKGMLAMGNRKPLSMNVGRIVIMTVRNIASICVFDTVEIRSPKLRETKMYSVACAESRSRLPRNGTLKIRRADTRIIAPITKPMLMYGSTFPTTISTG